jgi:hypothetical protein
MFGKECSVAIEEGVQGLQHAAVEMLSNGKHPTVEIVEGAVLYRWHSWKHTEGGSAVVKGTLCHQTAPLLLDPLCMVIKGTLCRQITVWHFCWI